jgi:peptidoglycan/LPS O-acetylase OafA/YrhL
LKRIKEIDGLRGIAILLVVSFHYINNQLVNATNPIARIICKITQFGWVGVDLFFVLSGFLIGAILLRNKDSKSYFSTFYIRRILRIIPNYYLLVLLFLFVNSINYFKDNSFLTGENDLPFWSYLFLCQNFFMAKFSTLGNHPMGVTWSIAIEEQFYIVFPFLLYKLKENHVPKVLLGIVIIAIASRLMFEHWITRYVLLICRMDALAIGILVAWLKNKFDPKDFCIKHRNLLYILLLADFLICAILYAIFNDLGVYKHTLFAIIFAIMLLFALGNNENYYGKLLRQKLLMWIGSISYSLYLFHDYVLGITYHIFGKKGVIIYNLYDASITILAFGISLFLSFFIFKLLETPMIAIGKKYEY